MNLTKEIIDSTICESLNEVTKWMAESIIVDEKSNYLCYYAGYGKGVLELGIELKKMLEEEKE